MSDDPAPIRPNACPSDHVRTKFVRGHKSPTAVTWFGIRSFWGHIWRGIAIAIVTDDIDFRDWMRTDPAEELTARVARELGATGTGESLTEALGEDLWIDFVADTGDDVSVSEAVGKILFARYDVPDPDDEEKRLVLPRGHVLMFGGDTAYPVATDLEIDNRVVRPWNRVLEGVDNSQPRCVIGVPGNHDWYGGIDGFGRLFHERRGKIAREERPPARETPKHQLEHFVQWVEALTIGQRVYKRRVLHLEGYTPAQRASYWALRLAPSLDVWGVDRQLSHVDFQQRLFFGQQPRDRGLLVVLPEPAYAFFEPHQPGVEMLQALDVAIGRDGLFVLAGDLHHYSRLEVDPGLQITAGGGGAFLHPARIARRSKLRNVGAEFPGPLASRGLAWLIPFAVLSTRAGAGVHVLFAVTYLLAYGLDRASLPWWGPSLAFVVAACMAFGTSGFRPGRRVFTTALCTGTALLIALLPPLVRIACWPFGVVPSKWGDLAVDVGLFLAETLGAVGIAGVFLMIVVLRGLAHGPFGALSHPGYKHFVRLRVRRDGSRVDGWVLGKIDPVRTGEPVVLVDRFTWKNPRPAVVAGP